MRNIRLNVPQYQGHLADHLTKGGEVPTLYMGAIAIDGEQLPWILWTFDSDPADTDFEWHRLEPALLLGFRERKSMPATMLPGTVVFEGKPDGWDD